MRPLHRSALPWTVAAVAILAEGQDVAAQQPGPVSVTAGYDTPPSTCSGSGTGPWIEGCGSATGAHCW